MTTLEKIFLWLHLNKVSNCCLYNHRHSSYKRSFAMQRLPDFAIYCFRQIVSWSNRNYKLYELKKVDTIYIRIKTYVYLVLYISKLLSKFNPNLKKTFCLLFYCVTSVCVHTIMQTVLSKKKNEDTTLYFTAENIVKVN